MAPITGLGGHVMVAAVRRQCVECGALAAALLKQCPSCGGPLAAIAAYVTPAEPEQHSTSRKIVLKKRRRPSAQLQVAPVYLPPAPPSEPPPPAPPSEPPPSEPPPLQSEPPPPPPVPSHHAACEPGPVMPSAAGPKTTATRRVQAQWAPAPPPGPARSGARLGLLAGKYQLEAEIGEGGAAIVYRAMDVSRATLCAIKVLRSDQLDFGPVFLKELENIQRIGPHPNIPVVFEGGVDPASALPFLVMELLEGQTLADRLAHGGPVAHAQACDCMAQIARALAHAHKAGVVHRDLKPANVFLSGSTVKVLDFGIAKRIGIARKTATEIGTPVYAAPEQMGPTIRTIAARQGKTIAQEIMPQTDIWAFGLVTYEVLTGWVPGQFWGTLDTFGVSFRIATEAIPKASVQAQDRAHLLPAGFDDWLDRCLQVHAPERWPTIGQAASTLLALFASGPQKKRGKPWRFGGLM
ncbi:MAG: serine/threonine-protein kinase [Myxococcales bacterium]